MIDSILPPDVAVAECFCDPPGLIPLPGEAEAVAGAVETRRREYRTVRHCARVALQGLGVAPAAVLTGKSGEPLWPDGVIGSMTHCEGYRAAAVALVGGSVASLGIDAEPHAALPIEVLTAIARPEERVHLAILESASAEVHWDRVLFSAKESIYKAWFPLARRWLGFDDASLEFDAGSGTFTATLQPAGLHVEGRALTMVHGRWQVHGGLLFTSAIVDT
jgi:4'-phosphopantetheinyl transferase EntD